MPEVLLCVVLAGLMMLFKHLNKKSMPSPTVNTNESPILSSKCEQHAPRVVSPKRITPPPGLEGLEESTQLFSKASCDAENPESEDISNSMARDLAKLNAPWRKAKVPQAEENERFVWKSQTKKDAEEATARPAPWKKKAPADADSTGSSSERSDSEFKA